MIIPNHSFCTKSFVADVIEDTYFHFESTANVTNHNDIFENTISVLLSLLELFL